MLVTKVLREGNSPAPGDKESLGPLIQGAVRFPGHAGGLIEFVIGGRQPSTRGRWEMRKPRGARQREEGGGKPGPGRAERTVAGPWEPCDQAGAAPTAGSPRGGLR